MCGSTDCLSRNILSLKIYVIRTKRDFGKIGISKLATSDSKARDARGRGVEGILNSRTPKISDPQERIQDLLIATIQNLKIMARRDFQRLFEGSYAYIVLRRMSNGYSMNQFAMALCR